MVATRKSVPVDFARSLFTRGTNFFGPEEVRRAFMIDLGDDVPPIPFSEEELVQARKLGQYLVLVSNKGANGKMLTMSDLCKATANGITNRNETFFSRPITLAPTWTLVSLEVIPGSVGQNYLGQTQAIVDHVLNEVYGYLVLPQSYRLAIEEFKRNKYHLAHLMNKDWKAAAKKLAALRVNQLFRETPGEVIYRSALYAKINHEYLLPQMCTWTKLRSSHGGLVNVGLFGSYGVLVDEWRPGDSSSNTGVCFSRRAVPKS